MDNWLEFRNARERPIPRDPEFGDASRVRHRREARYLIHIDRVSDAVWMLIEGDRILRSLRAGGGSRGDRTGSRANRPRGFGAHPGKHVPAQIRQEQDCGYYESPPPVSKDQASSSF